jgi:hypothetical protein
MDLSSFKETTIEARCDESLLIPLPALLGEEPAFPTIVEKFKISG